MKGYLDALEDILRGVPRIAPSIRPRLRVVWTASREWPRDMGHVAALVGSALYEHSGRDVQLAHGCARGGDQLAEALITHYRWTPRRYPVSGREWKIYGGYAGHQRNARMLEAEQPELVVALIWNRSRGATGCADNATARGIPVLRVDEELALLPRIRASL